MPEKTLLEKANEAAEAIKAKNDIQPRLALVLGSSQGSFAARVTDCVTISYKDIPYFKGSSVAGHAGELKIGYVKETPVYVFCGRTHMYEGYGAEEVTFPIRVLKPLGVKMLILTNAAGGINRNYEVGDFMLLKDHINFSARNPLCGRNEDEFGPRFPDMSAAYSARLNKLAKKIAVEKKIRIHEGVYAAMLGPNYETPAEVRMLSVMGVDAVGMSTVPEAIVSSHQGMETMAISSISNLAAGISPTPLSHDEVKEAAQIAEHKLFALLEGIIAEVNGLI